MTWYLCAAAACNVIFNPEWVSFNYPASGVNSSSVWWVFPPQCSLSRTNHPAHMLSGLTEQLLALSNQVKWPCLYADLQLDTSVYSHPVHFADTILQADASKQRSVSITAQPELVIFMTNSCLTLQKTSASICYWLIAGAAAARWRKIPWLKDLALD